MPEPEVAKAGEPVKEGDWKAVAKALAYETGVNQRLRSQLKGYKGQNKRLLKRTGAPPEPTEAESEPPEAPPKPSESVESHGVGAWHEYCPGCGGPNEHFRGPHEAKCKRCGVKVGRLENLRTEKNPDGSVKVCPGCGSDTFVPLSTDVALLARAEKLGMVAA